MRHLVPFQAMLQQARAHHFAVPAFNVSNMETAQGIAAAAEKARSPLIIQLYHADLEYAGEDYMVSIADTAALRSCQPVSLSLDHGQSFEQARRCIEAGFTGVMIDLSGDDFETNIQQTQRVVHFARERGVSVEAELGLIFDAAASLEIRNSGMTDPDAAEEFVRRTGVDALAVSIGTAHGVYSSAPKIDFDRVRQLVDKTPAPIVVHGGSNTPDEEIVELCRLGVAKINIGTDLMQAYNDGILEAFDKNGSHAPLRVIMQAARDSVQRCASHKISLLRTYAD